MLFFHHPLSLFSFRNFSFSYVAVLFFISCNIFLLFFICFFFAFIRIFVFIFSYVYFVNFYEWKNCFLSFLSLLRTEGETPSVYWLTNTEELFSSTKNILRYYFHFPFLCISVFSPSLLTFRLAHRLLFPSYSKQLDSLNVSEDAVFYLRKIRCNLTFFLSGFPFSYSQEWFENIWRQFLLQWAFPTMLFKLWK